MSEDERMAIFDAAAFALALFLANSMRAKNPRGSPLAVQ
jgi:hypothetical protein